MPIAKTNGPYSHPPPDGIYKCGFAKTSLAYRAAVIPLFEALDRVETLLRDKTYIFGDRPTEADIRLFFCDHRQHFCPHPSFIFGGWNANPMSCLDPIRSRLCLPFQVQHSNHSQRLP
jgi:Glutathione S-transferase, C-terminal domain